MKIGQSQEYQLRSIIQTYKTSGHYIVLSTTHDEDVYSKTCNEGQTNYINVCSDERSLHEDYIYIYQETSNPTPDFEFIQTSQNRTKKNLKQRSSLKKYSNKHNLNKT